MYYPYVGRPRTSAAADKQYPQFPQDSKKGNQTRRKLSNVRLERYLKVLVLSEGRREKGKSKKSKKRKRKEL